MRKSTLQIEETFLHFERNKNKKILEKMGRPGVPKNIRFKW